MSETTDLTFTPDEVVENVLEMCLSQSFFDFFAGPFNDYLEGEEDALSKDDILEVIKSHGWFDFKVSDRIKRRHS